MSDLFKDHKPELSDDEDRRLWQRVRAIPGEAEGFRHAPVPWWRALWAMPAVRYGAPAFAVLVAAVVWVTERGPEPTLKVQEPARVSTRAATPPAVQPAPDSQAPEEAPTVAMRAVTPPADHLRARSSLSKDEKAQPERQEAALDQGARGGAAPEPELIVQQQEHVIVPAPAKTMALRKGEPAPAPTAQTFAPPPKEAAKNSTPSPSANWGSVKSNYRDSGSAGAQQRLLDGPVSIVEGLEQGVLPGAAALASHAIVANVADAARLGSLSGRVSFPKEALGDQEPAIAIVEIPASGRIEARVEGASARTDRMLSIGGGTTNFEAAPPRLQVAVLAFALERALAAPGTPRYRLENMLELSKKIGRRAGPDARPGADRLTHMLEGALRAWPRD
jgi:hypothetical protein